MLKSVTYVIRRSGFRTCHLKLVAVPQALAAFLFKHVLRLIFQYDPVPSVVARVLHGCLIPSLTLVEVVPSVRGLNSPCGVIESNIHIVFICLATGVSGDGGAVVVADEVRERATVGRPCYASRIAVQPVLELLWHVFDLVDAIVSRLIPVEDGGDALCNLLVGLEDGDGVAAAQRMPASKLKILGIAPLAAGVAAASWCAQLVADVVEWLAVECVVVRQLDTYADHKVQLLPAEVVGRVVGDVGLGGGEAAGVLVAAAVDTAPWMVGCCGLAQPQDAVCVPHAAEQLVGLLQIAAQVAAHLVSRPPLSYPDVEAELYLVLELPGVFPRINKRME